MLLENFIISNVIFARRAIFSTLYIGTEHRLNFSQLRLRGVHGNGKDWDPMGFPWELRRGNWKKTLHIV